MKQLIKIGKRPYLGVWVLSGLVMLLVGLACQSAQAARITVSAVVDRQQVYVGESFQLQIQVDGNDSPAPPDLTGLADFTVSPQGGQQNNSTSISIINGKMTKVSHNGYVFNYLLTPTRAGKLIIPDLEVRAAGASYYTLPVTIEAVPPHETKDFKLRQDLEKSSCYVGEPVKLTVTWYIGKDVKGFNFNLPVISDDNFTVHPDPEAPTKADKDNLLAIPLAKGQEVVARKSHGILNGQDFLTVSFTRILVPKVAGELTLPSATVSAKALAGRQPRGNFSSPFDNFFNDNFFGHSQNIYRTVVVPSNTPTLNVLPLPTQGRPADFNGLVGDYSLLVSASPTTVKVGDPITLTIQVAGPYVGNVKLPPLQNDLPAADFKVPSEMSPGEGQGMLKTFTQTVRARHAGVREVPSLSLSYFNVKSGKYETARSKPVPLQVSGNRIVTAQDAEGGGGITGVTKSDVQAAKGGINYNYEGQDVLVNQTDFFRAVPDRTFIIMFVGLPPALYIIWLLGLQIVRIRQRDPAGRASRRAYHSLQAALQVVEHDKSDSTSRAYELLAKALLDYLGAKLKLKQAVITYADVEPALLARGVDQGAMESLQKALAQCEAGQYAGGAMANKVGNLIAMVEEAAHKLEKFL